MSQTPVCQGVITVITAGPSAPFSCSANWIFYDTNYLYTIGGAMTQSIKCDGTIAVVAGPSAPFACTGTWIFYETPVITEVSAPEISNYLFVLSLCVAFAMGFHKGGQR